MKLDVIFYLFCYANIFFCENCPPDLCLGVECFTPQTSDGVECRHLARRNVCDCCPECVRNVNETCGIGFGICDEGLFCVPTKNLSVGHLGLCLEKSLNECSEDDCEVTFPICAEDSRLVKLARGDGDCCLPPPVCVCDLQRCVVSDCGEGMERALIRKGTNETGRCCDYFECRPRALHCEDIKCPQSDETRDLYSEDGQSCPDDSFRPASYVPDGSCCSLIPECRCKASICPPMRCSNGMIPILDRKGTGLPGKCCDKFHCRDKIGVSAETHCLFGGKTYAEGEQWNHNSCQSCWCSGGVALCKKMQCPHVSNDCNWFGIPEGECCQICLGCKDDNGLKMHVGDSWIKDDCTTCVCGIDFRPECQRHICKTDCDHPQKVEGQCCPVCNEPTIVKPPIMCSSVELCPLKCKFGLLRNQWGCFECSCALSSMPDFDAISPLTTDDDKCHELNELSCDKQCAHGYLKDHRGCITCRCAKCPPTAYCYKHCLYGFETNLLGCPVCKCRPKSHIYARLMIHSEYVQDRQNDLCKIVEKMGNKLIERDSGEWWTDGKCRQCFCQDKVEYCSLISCPVRPADCSRSHWRIRKGDCCHSCSVGSSLRNRKKQHSLTVCHSPGTGHMFVDGETWKLDDCISCTCRVGHVLCTTEQCQPTPCSDPVIDTNNTCCKICPIVQLSALENKEELDELFCKDEGGNVHMIGSMWREDECRSCLCSQSGIIQCFDEICQDFVENCSGRPLSIKGRCCPVCSNILGNESVCNFNGNVYGVNEEFRDGPCRNCSCRTGGQIECLAVRCPDCGKVVSLPNMCCPLCGDSTVYSLEGTSQTVFVNHSMEYLTYPVMVYASLVGLALLLLGICVAIVLIIGKLILGKKIHTNKLMETGRTDAYVKQRNASESESANVSLLSGSDIGTGGGSEHSETAPLTPSRRFPTVASKFV